MGILAEEVLGLNVWMNEEFTVDQAFGQPEPLYLVAGCEQNLTESASWRCGGKSPRTHAAVGAYLQLESQEAVLAEVQRLRVGGILDVWNKEGYETYEGLTVSQRLADLVLEVEGLSLDYYRSFHVRHRATYLPYFHKIHDINESDLVPCAGWSTFFPQRLEAYLQITGDTDGVTVEASGTHIQPRCHESRWWLAPTCRENSSESGPEHIKTYQ